MSAIPACDYLRSRVFDSDILPKLALLKLSYFCNVYIELLAILYGFQNCEPYVDETSRSGVIDESVMTCNISKDKGSGGRATVASASCEPSPAFFTSTAGEPYR